MMANICKFMAACCIILAVCSQSSAVSAASGGLKIIYTANTFGTVRPCPT
ncbi:MAG: hypothetical protein K9J81_00655 [Desulfohalobiaceae bacterium]|nr:hypothetical protein [Desulfohalobiaceae bacterium]